LHCLPSALPCTASLSPPLLHRIPLTASLTASVPPPLHPQGISADFRRFAYWFRDSAGTADQQEGVFRTNCIDCLDRTNVVQVCGGWSCRACGLLVCSAGSRVLLLDYSVRRLGVFVN
jgi:hypothetical protein